MKHGTSIANANHSQLHFNGFLISEKDSGSEYPKCVLIVQTVTELQLELGAD